jgi:hypothetical protein
MRNLLQLSILICFISFASCKKNQTATSTNGVYTNNNSNSSGNTGSNGTGGTTTKVADLTKNVKNISEMIVPDNFNFDNNRLVNINLSLTNNTYSTPHLITICDADPTSNLSTISQGSI